MSTPRPDCDYTTLTYKQMVDIIRAIWKEIKRRNPIGVNVYYGAVENAALAVDEISLGEAGNFTSENGPREPRRKSK